MFCNLLLPYFKSLKKDAAFLGSGETEVELICNQTDKNVDIKQGITLGFEVESINETIEFLHLKDIESGEVVQLGPQSQCLFIFDPNGIRIQIIEYLQNKSDS